MRWLRLPGFLCSRWKGGEAVNITQSQLKDLVLYDSETGVFTWRRKFGRKIVVGSVAGHVCKRFGYVKLGVNGRIYMAHRLAYLYMTGAFPESFLDHINGNRADNRWENLRDADAQLNNQNHRHASSHNKSSGLLGVSWRQSKGKWRASITVDRRSKHIGYFGSSEEAHAAYVAAKRVLHAGCTL